MRMKKTESPTWMQVYDNEKEKYHEEDTYVNVIELNEPKKLAVLMEMDYLPKSNGLDFSFGEVNAAFSDIADVNILPVYENNASSDFEALTGVDKQKVQRSMVLVLGVLLVIVLVTLVAFIANIYPQYFTVSGVVTDLQQNVSEFQKHAMEEQDNLKTKVADLGDLMDYIVSGVAANIHHNVSEFQKHAMKEKDNLKTQVADLSDLMEKVCTVCPIGWHTIGSSCYYLSGERRTWEEARDECYKVNSLLLMIKDKNKSDSLNTLFNSNRSYWMGLRRDSKNIHIWKWLDGSEVTFTNWGVKEPNFYRNEEYCGENLSGPWNDENCDDKLYYICEKNRFC